MRKPERLRPGDKVAIVSLSSGMLGEPEYLHKYHIAKERLEGYGLTVVPMPNALKGRDYLYRHPEARAQDLMDAFRDPEIKAVFNAIGGDDTIRILPYVDLEVLRANPKIFTGFSDTTANHFMMHHARIVSYYGLSVVGELGEYVEMNEYTQAMMESTLFEPRPRLEIPACSYWCAEEDKVKWSEKNMVVPMPRFPCGGYEIVQGKGVVRGELLGGCVELFLMLAGTTIWPGADGWKGKLLLMETSECDMSEEYLTWFLRSLHAQGILHAVNGIVFGRPAFASKQESYRDVLRRVVGIEAGLPDLPILYNLNAGHAWPTGVFPLGLTYEIDCEKKTFTLTEPATR